MNTYKLLFLDIDGTILKIDDTIEDSTKKAISDVKEKGLEVFLATGRPLHEIYDIAKELGVNSYIGYNGAYAIYNGEDFFKKPMEGKTVQSFLEIAKNHGHEIVMYTSSQNVLTSFDSPAIKDFVSWFHLRNNERFYPSVIHNILGMTILNLKEENLILYEGEQGIHLSQVNVEGMHHCYDVIRDTVNKGISIKMILDYLGISKEQAIAFGDGMNDKEMLQVVGESFAMGNAHPHLFPYAKYITTTVDDSGVYNGLKLIGLVD